jgi:hypothetical protein
MGQYEDLTAMINARKQQLKTTSSSDAKRTLIQGINNLERQRDRTTPEKKPLFRSPFGGKKRRTKRRKGGAKRKTRRMR